MSLLLEEQDLAGTGLTLFSVQSHKHPDLVQRLCPGQLAPHKDIVITLLDVEDFARARTATVRPLLMCICEHPDLFQDGSP